MNNPEIIKRLDRIERLLLDVLDRNPEALTATGKVQIRGLAQQMVQEKNSKGRTK